MTVRFILDTFNHEELFALAGFDISNGFVCNPLRDDRTPGCKYHEFEGVLYFSDFTGFFGKNSINGVEALKHATGISNNAVLFKYIKDHIDNIEKPEKIETPSHDILIDIVSKPFPPNNYFSKYHIPQRALEIEGIVNIEEYYANSKRNANMRRNLIGSPETHPMVAYSFEDRVKIYNPYGTIKWFGNVVQDDIYGFESFDRNSDYVVLTKSGKDFLVLKYVLGFQSVALQGENMMITNKLLNILEDRKVIVIFDNDKVGMERSFA